MNNIDGMVENCLFVGNSTGDNGLGLGGGILDTNSQLEITNCTIALNHAENGGGIFIANAVGGPSTNVVNTVVWNNTAVTSGDQIENVSGTDPSISYCDIQDSGGSGAGWDDDLGTDDGDNIDTDPLFEGFTAATGNWLTFMQGTPVVDNGDGTSTFESQTPSPAWTANEHDGRILRPDRNRDEYTVIISHTTSSPWKMTVGGTFSGIWYNKTYEIYDFHLGSSSPCIDTGDPSSTADGDDPGDLGGLDRKVDGINNEPDDCVEVVDMGAYEAPEVDDCE